MKWVYLILIFGCILGLAIASAELIGDSKQNNKEYQVFITGDEEKWVDSVEIIDKQVIVIPKSLKDRTYEECVGGYYSNPKSIEILCKEWKNITYEIPNGLSVKTNSLASKPSLSLGTQSLKNGSSITAFKYDLTNENFIKLGDNSIYVYLLSNMSSQSVNITSEVMANTPNRFSHLTIDKTKYPYANLVGYYSFDINSTAQMDYTTRNIDMVIVGANFYNDTGKFGGGYFFNGKVANYLRTPTGGFGSEVSIRNKTITLWARRDGQSDYTGQENRTTFFAKANQRPEAFITFNAPSRTEMIYWGGSQHSVAGSNYTMCNFPLGTTFNKWTHFAFTAEYNGVNTNLSIYVNGTICNSTILISYLQETNQLLWRVGEWGAETAGGVAPFNGTFDEFMFFNASLDANNISAIYNSQLQRFSTYGYGVYNYTFSQNISELNVTTRLTNNGTNITLDFAYQNSTGWYNVVAGNINDSNKTTFNLFASNNFNLTYGYSPDTNLYFTPNLVNITLETTNIYPLTLKMIYPFNNTHTNKTVFSFNISSNQPPSYCGLSIDGDSNLTMTINDTKANYTKGLFPFGYNKVTNGGFDSDTAWSKTGAYISWIISGGVASLTYTGIPPENAYLQQDVGITVGRTYNLTYTLSTSGSIHIITPYSGDQVLNSVNMPGRYSQIYTATSSGNLSFFGVTGGMGLASVTIDNVSVRELNNTHNYLIYCNDSNGYEGYTTGNILIDTSYPLINFTSPTTEDGTETGEKNYSIVVNISSSDNNNPHSVLVDIGNMSWWRMDDQNDTSVFDYFGNNNGTKIGVNQTFGMYGDGMSFEYLTSEINVGSKTVCNLNGQNNWTMSGWVYDYGNSSYTVHIIYGEGRTTSTIPTCYMSVVANVTGIYPLLGIRNDAGTVYNTYANTSRPLSYNKWYHVLATYNGTAIYIYVDGEYANKVVVSGAITLNRGTIGGLRYVSLVNVMNGSIDDVVVARRYFTPNEIKALYNATAENYSNIIKSLGNYYGNYSFKGYAQDIGGNINFTDKRTVEVIPSKILIDILYPNISYIQTANNRWFNISINVTCKESDCGTVNVSLDPIVGGCDESTQTCGSSCEGIFEEVEPFGVMDFTYATSFYGGWWCYFLDPTSVCYSYDNGNNYYATVQDSECDMYLSAGNGDCAIFDDETAGSEGDWYICPSYARKGSAVTSSDCTCASCMGVCGRSISSLFDFNNQFFTGISPPVVKTGLIPINAGSPFYTNDSNPRNITLIKDESKLVTFWVMSNTTSYNNNFTFFAYANKTGDMALNNMSQAWNVTVKCWGFENNRYFVQSDCKITSTPDGRYL